MIKQINPLLSNTLLLTLTALVAFAANSVLCRYALEDGELDAASFTILRLLSGIVMLIIIISVKNFGKKLPVTSRGDWFAALMLFSYATCFSFAYVTIDAGLGALILFGSVQITMIFLSLRAGHQLNSSEWLGVIIAFSGFVYLMIPDKFAPPISGVALMLISGISWAIYTVKGQGSQDALLDTSYNFIKTLPFIFILALFSFKTAHFSSQGLVLAIISGAVTSALGYVVWYRAIRELKPVQAAVSQLLVPVIAIIGGVIFLSEAITTHTILASLLILGGIMLVTLGHYSLVTK